jgi:Zn finger protein HypA/HybF involved in hydrogenase expression
LYSRKYTNEQVFTENSTYARHHIKKRLIEDKLIKYECSVCFNKGIYNDKPLSLQLEHINGISDDNRLSNLEFLCPNCHSQTDTYAGKGSKGKRKVFNGPKSTKNFNENKLESDKNLWEKIKTDSSIGFGAWGWKGRLSKKIGINPRHVVPWIKRIDEDFVKLYE